MPDEYTHSKSIEKKKMRDKDKIIRQVEHNLKIGEHDVEVGVLEVLLDIRDILKQWLVIENQLITARLKR